ncbi:MULTISPECIES: hypothetical protein [Pseudomonas]|jgi:hypothetical protein|uniref:Transmembrane protein n=1 Tax=Pseudomonas fluorescens TaxID=294 RepID=A0A0F4TVL0_PSEFL|nr:MULTISPECIES: hypothetical protein [Pseudomonas]KJZ47417.1 hypothetical protein VC35_10270 [Pseudomonas fluorescens]
MSVSVAQKLFLCISLTGFGGLLIFLCVSLHLAYAKMDVMLDHLKNCPAIMVRAPFKNGGAWGRLFVLGAVMGVMTMPNFYLRDGGADAKDLEAFPGGLRKKLIVLHWGGVACIALLLALFAVNALGYIQ